MQRENKWQDRFYKKFTAVDWSEKRSLIDIVGYDILPDLEAFIQSEIDTAIAERDKEIIKILENTKLPVNSSNGGMTTLVYIPNEPFNKQINDRIEWIINLITKEQ